MPTSLKIVGGEKAAKQVQVRDVPYGEYFILLRNNNVYLKPDPNGRPASELVEDEGIRDALAVNLSTGIMASLFSTDTVAIINDPVLTYTSYGNR